MHIRKATDAYEAWLGEQIPLLREDLEKKHQEMARAAFPFLRATYYRWAQVWPALCPDLQAAPEVLAVGDLHVENFGAWRDAEGRLVWGTNDFDEAARLPYTNDLVRLAASARLAREEHDLAIEGRDAVGAILEGYRDGLRGPAEPFVLAGQHEALRKMAGESVNPPAKFWARLEKAPDAIPPPEALEALHRMLPEGARVERVVHRSSGLGSLGRERYTAIASWRGGRVAREAKATAAPASAWAAGKKAERPLYEEILSRAVRCPDPWVRLEGRWIVRRLAPDCARIELGSLPGERDEARLLRAMGRETANVHRGTGEADKLLADLEARPEGWLRLASKRMAEAVAEDFHDWPA